MTSAKSGLEVPMLDLKAQYRPLRDAIEAAIREVCDSQQFIMGAGVEELEKRIADYCTTECAVGMSSGTDALLAALMALDIGPDDVVVTTAYSFFATAGAIARLGARPAFCDIDGDTCNLDPAAVERFLRRGCRTVDGRLVCRASGGTVKAIVPAHLFGRVADMEALAALASEFGLSIVEDAAQAIGAEGRAATRAGSVGDIGCLSFFPSKNLGAFGDAGMCVTRSETLAERLRMLRVHGGSGRDQHPLVGGNFRLDALQAAVLIVKLPHLDAWTRARQENAARYTEAFRNLAVPVRTPAPPADGRHVFNQYVIETERRDELKEWLHGNGIGSGIYYSAPLHLQKCFSSLGYVPGDCPVAEAVSRRTLAIPVYPELSQVQQGRVIDSVAKFFGISTN